MITIPRIIHQTWKNESLPRSLKRFQKTWREHHRDWEYRLWTDADNRVFLQAHYEWFMPVYETYPEKIMQVDAVRYFILHHFGGVYADLDLECLRSIDSLLEDKQLILGCEPPQHLAEHGVAEGGRILCNAFMASVPDHPFWEHVMQVLPARSDEVSPLSATGPFFLTKAYEAYADKQKISIESHEVLYPLGKGATARRSQRLPMQAYTVHHWSGSWWSSAYSPKSIAQGVVSKVQAVLKVILKRVKPWLRRIYFLARPDHVFRYLLYLSTGLSSRVSLSGVLKKPQSGGQMWISRMSSGECVARALMDISTAHAALEKAGYPRVSCLMVTRDRVALAKRSVECFRKQTYPNRELVIVDDDPGDDLEQWVNSLHDPQIQYLRLADEGKSLGELRNLSLQSAQGEYVSQWDDDDISHPDRLLLQMLALSILGVDAALLHQQMLWWPDRRYLGVSSRGLLENTMVARKDKVSEYQALEKGEDTPLCNELVKTADVVLCDKPDLYIYVFHGGNTWDEKHFEGICESSTIRYKGSEYDRALNELQKSYELILDERAPTLVAHAQRLESVEAPAAPAPAASIPAPQSMLVLTPVKNAASHLQQFVQNLDAATYPKDKLSLAFLESDSDDGTYDAIKQMLPELRERYVRVELFKRDFDYRTSKSRWIGSEQFTRRSILAKSRNLLLSSALRDEEWVLWLDVDLLSWPADAIEKLLATNEDIVVPHCIRPDGNTFDLNTFVLSKNADQLDWSRYICDGILQPPVGYGRQYLGEFAGHERVEVDGVGGTMLLIRADIHRQGLNFPAYSHDGYIETEGLARVAKEMGYGVYGLPDLTIVHVDR